jgi:hypothetical protein
LSDSEKAIVTTMASRMPATTSKKAQPLFFMNRSADQVDIGTSVAMELSSLFFLRGEFRMKKLLILATMAAVVVGCNRSSTMTSGPAAPGETHTSKYTPDGNRTVMKTLTLTVGNDYSISRGGTEKVMITISRENFKDPVTIAFDNLPQGVGVVDNKSLVIPADSKTLTLTLKAEANAAIGEHVVTVDASAPGVETNKHQFKLTVK